MLLLHFGQCYDGFSYCIFGDSGPGIRQVALKTVHDCVRGSLPSATELTESRSEYSVNIKGAF